VGVKAPDGAVLPSNAAVADQFGLLADLMEIEGGDGFRIGAYRKAATRIRETSSSVAQLALDGKAKELQGIGKTIEEKIVEVVREGEIRALTARKAEVPLEVASFLQLPGLGPKTARRLWRELGITTLAQLRDAAEASRLRDLEGLGARSEERILAALQAPRPAEGRRRTLLGSVLPRLRDLAAALDADPASVSVSIAGSARRYRETVRDLDLIATATDPAALIDTFCSLPFVVEVAARGDTKATIVGQDGLRFDLRVVPPQSYGNLLQHFTGSKEHNVALREAAVRRGLSVSEYAITDTETGEAHAFATEEEVYAFLGYDWIPPELRENRGELEAARQGGLPGLVEVSSLRGDLHTHTTWSDGKDPLETMVAAAAARGYDYYAICDHSHRMRGHRLAEQRAAIAGLGRRLPIRVLHGVEVNIKADGGLDVPDSELAKLDWVVASVHHGFADDPTGRVLSAMENPYVDCIGHLTGRKIGRRESSPIDLERVIERALATGTFIEINSQPDRLDLSDVHARAAGEAGLPLVIDSDAHQVSALAYVELGVGQARRAWLSPDQIVNSRSWDEIEPLRKRRPGTA
jgi:DNA polymerase (family 10)